MSSLRESIAKFMWRDGHEEDGVNTDKLWEGMPDRFKTAWLDSADELLALLREYGLVELDKDQSLPKNPYAVDAIFNNQCHASGRGYIKGQQDMVEAGFKKVKEMA